MSRTPDSGHYFSYGINCFYRYPSYLVPAIASSTTPRNFNEIRTHADAESSSGIPRLYHATQAGTTGWPARLHHGDFHCSSCWRSPKSQVSVTARGWANLTGYLFPFSHRVPQSGNRILPGRQCHSRNIRRRRPLSSPKVCHNQAAKIGQCQIGATPSLFDRELRRQKLKSRRAPATFAWWAHLGSNLGPR
jgi:hypothetical protein